MKSILLKQVFETERQFCNQAVSQAKHQSPLLEISDFQWFLTACLDPLMVHYDTVDFEEAKAVALSGFQHGLELTGLNWFKQPERKDLILNTWNTLFPNLLLLVSKHPGMIFSQTSNLYSHLLTFGDLYPKNWLTLMVQVSSTSILDSPKMYQSAGFAAAWLSGLAHLRDPALKEVHSLPSDIVMSLFKITEPNKVDDFLTRLNENRWISTYDSHPSRLLTSSYQPQIRVGQNSHLGGDFPEPPTVYASENQLLVKSGSLVWRLYADAFGATMILAHLEDLTNLPDMANHPDILAGFSSLTELEDLRAFSSVACLTDTLALTSEDSFSVIIMSLPYIEPEG